MEYLDAYLLKEKKKRPALFPDFERPEQFADTDGEVEITFLLLPSRWRRLRKGQGMPMGRGMRVGCRMPMGQGMPMGRSMPMGRGMPMGL